MPLHKIPTINLLLLIDAEIQRGLSKDYEIVISQANSIFR